uniref:Pecanex-like protein n=1 Tax=Soboliphyme baturini TaxID=241478 RepID=A0A183J9G6_9BILA
LTCSNWCSCFCHHRSPDEHVIACDDDARSDWALALAAGSKSFKIDFPGSVLLGIQTIAEAVRHFLDHRFTVHYVRTLILCFQLAVLLGIYKGSLALSGILLNACDKHVLLQVVTLCLRYLQLIDEENTVVCKTETKHDGFRCCWNCLVCMETLYLVQSSADDAANFDLNRAVASLWHRLYDEFSCLGQFLFPNRDGGVQENTETFAQQCSNCLAETKCFSTQWSTPLPIATLREVLLSRRRYQKEFVVSESTYS